MGLPEILAIFILCGICAVVILLIILLRRTGNKNAVTADGLDAAARRAIDTLLREERSAQSTLRTELQGEIRASRTETVNTVQTSVERLGQTLRESQRQTAELQDRRLGELIEAQDRQFAMQDKRLDEIQKSLNALLAEKMDGLTGSVNRRLEEIDKQFRTFREQSLQTQEQTRRTMEERLGAMQTQNAEQLEKMRATVDEKLQKTLDERISQSFKMVNDRLAEVYKGLGEMQTLAGSVGDLKKVLSNVKTRGILGELQLGAIMQELLAPEQYEENVITKPSTQYRVEFAVRLPGDGESVVYLPIDAKFPGDAYHHLLEAYDSGDAEQIKEAGSILEKRIKEFAKDIHDKYIDPPHTTTFGIMFLPFEGLYAEVVRRGLIETLQRQYQVSVAGPTTLAALLNSLRMGFKTLAIQKRSGEVWEVLGAVKTEFGNFEKVLAKAKERIEQTGDELDKLIGTRTRQINRKLRSVAELPAAEAQRLIDSEEEA